MSDAQHNSSGTLRRKAEIFLQKSPSAIKKMSARAIKNLVEELQIHQVELEMQAEELLRSEKNVIEARERYEDLYDFAPVGYATLLNGTRELFVFYDKDLKIMWGNKAAADSVNMDPKDLEGRHCYEIWNQMDRPCQGCPVLKALETGQPQETERATPDGRSWSLWAHPVFADNGTLLGACEFGQDITRRKKLEADLRQSQKMEAIGNLAGGIAHEFNNMLGIILGNTELAMDDVPDWNPASESLKEIKSATLRAKEVVRQILAFARKSYAQKKPFKIATVVDGCIKLMRASIPSTIQIDTHLNCEGQMVIGNPTEIHQILMNLCSNAVHAMGIGPGKLTVALDWFSLDHIAAQRYEGIDAGEYVSLRVQDTGCGMPADTLERIFDPYFTTGDIGHASGMGLAVVYGIVKKCDGAVKAVSEVGHGTSIEVLLPLFDDREAPIKKEDDKTLSKGSGQWIMFVDDEPSMVKLFKLNLERFGYQVVGITDSPEALECFREDPNKYDLVITDMSMPRIAGDELARQLLAIRPEIPILLCTGHSDSIDAKRAKSLGIKGYLMKPLDREKLALEVSRMLES